MPVVQYFSEQFTSIGEDDKKGAKVRKAAFNNLIYTLYYLDMHDEVIAWSEKNLDSKNLCLGL